MTVSDEHLEPLRLFDIARHSGTQLTEDEKRHLHTCEECRRIVEIFARQFPNTAKPEDAA